MKLKYAAASALILAYVPLSAIADDRCESLAAVAKEQAVPLIPRISFKVAGKNRLHFHSAPAGSCKSKSFVVPNDELIGYEEDGDWMFVMYTHPVTGEITDGWVDSDRLSIIGTMSPTTAP